MSSLQGSYSKPFSIALTRVDGQLFDQIRKSELPEKQLITPTLADEGLGIDSEHYLQAFTSLAKWEDRPPRL